MEMKMAASTASGARTGRIAAMCAVLGLATVGIAAAPRAANAWWSYGWGAAGGYAPPVVVAPAPAYYYPSPAYYYPRPAPAWIPGHWQYGYWVPGHWN
jgi:hypothetical protein